ncbi:MAG: hybrid sensor histidine kinase/response regulator [Candidatus Limnocylindrales bacterium]
MTAHDRVRARVVPTEAAGPSDDVSVDGRTSQIITSVGQVPMDRLRSIFDGMFDGVWLVGADQCTTYANRAMAGLLGTTPAELHGRAMTEFVDEALWTDVNGFLDRQRIQAGERMELRLRRADGSDLFGLIAGSPILTPDGTFVGTMLNVSDMTGKRSMDAQLVQNQRLEAVGQFAGGVAHDFNNLLTSIRGYAELALQSLVPGDPVRDDIAHVLVSADKAAGVVRTLLAFSRRQILAPVDVDPARIVNDLVPILRPLLGDRISLDIRVDSTHAWVRVDPTQLEQVIVNLAINARDAMPAGGTLTITVADLADNDPALPDPDQTSGPFVRISVSDDGIGMDDETKARIFDPFFTTKGPGKGTGLGLSTVFGIVAQSGGELHLQTQPGQGSTFSVDLPRVGAVQRLTVGRPVIGTARTTGMVLLVEDDASIREFAERVLRSAGYEVLEASDGDQGLAISEAHAGPIDLLMTDIMMPGIDGRELAARIRAKRPTIGIVVISGYADVGQDLEAEAYFLAKPFSVAALMEATARALAARPTTGPAPAPATSVR